jgi:hypothetical protein
MDYPPDTQLKSMALSLREHIHLANELELNFTARLLAMAVMEITRSRNCTRCASASRKSRLATAGRRSPRCSACAASSGDRGRGEAGCSAGRPFSVVCRSTEYFD